LDIGAYSLLIQKQTGRGFFRGPSFYKTFGRLRRMESLGDWRSSGVLLHQPLVKKAIPEKLVPQSELICRRLFRYLLLTQLAPV
jgi:hypothetical protein